ncbi:Prepilin-type N-terminal cleavage/methylation domain-containing protein [Tenacibaculum maritimum]|uniref:PulJ/GspJ family protein n=3 Tax=Tenacibaculum maritimum TaxID=107401 RepID=UPI0012E6981D|nr:type II secretion system protein [Tenacibaculum maritimum]CAA0165568.1 Prepilin-type N-terminal cleavage/methylation domain-containing protein [Tenacibaculum maritimum]CAA0248963.1 Prepilin-type N-terminal cleavage/methylation domain-containing protein [Tenacibaculum maritimum]CAA0251433.1 Prepilin-type N-terminal cleavage/methylation domain-containing protein [Tenacibaculum maritimum]
MKFNKKIKAFTLSEMLVVLVISSILISLTFLILSMVQQQVEIIQGNLKRKQQVQFLERVLWKDFNEYSVVYNQENTIFLLKNSIDSLTYKFNETFVLRGEDTLPIKKVTKKMFLDGKEVFSGEIDAILLTTPTNLGNMKLFIYKAKDASFYMRN